jgi:hypothetical protein
LICLKAGSAIGADLADMEWQLIATAPFDRDLELAVIDTSGIHTVVFPCRRNLRGWEEPNTKVPVEVHPTHWREWGYATVMLAACARAASLTFRKV